MTIDACPRAPMITDAPAFWPRGARLLVMFSGLVVLLVAIIVTRQVFGGQIGTDWVLSSWRTSPLVIPIMVSVFVVLSFLTVPQFVLISMCVVVFGPLAGFGIAWGATMLAAGLGFYSGPLIRKTGLSIPRNQWVDPVAAFVARNGFWSALFVRFIPFGPFVLINMALGASRTHIIPFLFGTGIGILPKAILIALAGSGLAQAVQGRYQAVVLVLALLALIWVILTVLRQGLGHNADKTRENCVPKP